MARQPKGAAIETIETTELYTLDYTVPANTVSTPSLVVTNLSTRALSIAVYVNNTEDDFLLKLVKVPSGIGKAYFVKELHLEKLNTGFQIKLQSETSDKFNSFLSVSEVSDS